jgi:hypothetical protein
MPRYFLHIHDGETIIPDPDGRDYADLEAALFDAREGAREMLAEKLLKGAELDGQRIEIMDADGALVDTVMFADQLNIPNPA